MATEYSSLYKRLPFIWITTQMRRVSN